MAVHVPLSLEAQLEARRADDVDEQHPAPRERRADHRAVAGHRARALLPVHLSDSEPGEGMAFGNNGEIEHALAAKAITLHTKIRGRYKDGRRRRQAGDADP